MPKPKEVDEPIEEKKDKYYAAEIATATEQVIVNRETEEQFTTQIAIAKIMSDVEEIKKALK